MGGDEKGSGDDKEMVPSRRRTCLLWGMREPSQKR